MLQIKDIRKQYITGDLVQTPDVKILLVWDETTDVIWLSSCSSV